MKRTLDLLFPMFALVLLLFGSRARADGATNGCFGGSHTPESKDLKLASARLAPPSRSETRRVGVGLLSAAFMTSGWLFFRRQGPRG